LLCIGSAESCTFLGSKHIGGAGTKGREAGVTRSWEEALVADVIGDIHEFSEEALWLLPLNYDASIKRKHLPIASVRTKDYYI
jgi:hypothetical protein